MLSVLSGHTDCVYSLLNKGASVEAKDKWGRTALHRGVRRVVHTHTQKERGRLVLI
jgi:ankyrin repeat protein